ncbi:MAG: hypothetical protein M1358_24340 [Chloroflexi bacterium]|nr:hypothetical protein [Chloroflexota bacterium]
MGRKLKLAISVIAVILVGTIIFVGTALAQPPTPTPNGSTPDRAQITEWMQGMMESVHGPGSFDNMAQWMDQVHGPGSFDSMVDWMSQGGGCGGAFNGNGPTNGAAPQNFRGGMGGGRSGGMMGGYY